MFSGPSHHRWYHVVGYLTINAIIWKTHEKSQRKKWLSSNGGLINPRQQLKYSLDINRIVFTIIAWVVLSQVLEFCFTVLFLFLEVKIPYMSSVSMERTIQRQSLSYFLNVCLSIQLIISTPTEIQVSRRILILLSSSALKVDNAHSTIGCRSSTYAALTTWNSLLLMFFVLFSYLFFFLYTTLKVHHFSSWVTLSPTFHLFQSKKQQKKQIKNYNTFHMIHMIFMLSKHQHHASII